MIKPSSSGIISYSLPNSPTEPISNLQESNKTRHLTPENDFIISKFVSQRLNQWHTNDEVFKILDQCNQLSSLASKNSYYKQLKDERFTKQNVKMPINGSVFVFDRREVKNYKKDSFLWKRRKTGSSKSVREDRMSLKVNGIESIYGCYSHSYIMPTFHRRIYWLLGKPDIVLVHYLQIPNNESGECLLSINLKNTDFQFNKVDVIDQLKSMIWPYYMNIDFVTDNLKLNNQLVISFNENDDFKSYFINSICDRLFESKIYKINFLKFIKNLNDSNQHDLLLDENKLTNQTVNNDDNKFKQHEKFQSNQVKLSLDYCSSEGGERLMLISDWKSDAYYMILNDKILSLNKLNTHVIETILPKFENLTQQSMKTLIYVFENQELFCEPIPFEIKNNSINSVISDDYKNKYFLLERVLMLYKYYRLNSLELNQIQSASTQSNQDNQLFGTISFENRLYQMIDNLINHLSSSDINIQNLSAARFAFDNEHEGKTLVNLCIDSNYLSIFKCLERLNSLINLKKTTDFSLLKNELDLFTLDHHGINPLMLVCRNGNEIIANEAFKWIENDLMNETSTHLISSWIYSLLKSKEEAIKHSHSHLVSHLDILLEKAQTKLNNLQNSIVLDLNLIADFDLSSLLDHNDETAQTNLFQNIQLDDVITNSELTNLLNETDLIENSFESAHLNDSKVDDQDDKIKTLADNIIAAMPHKIKINNYIQNDSNDLICNNNNSNSNKLIHFLKRNAASLDENITSDFSETNLDSITNLSSNRSSLSLSSSQSFQYSNEVHFKETSPDENSNSSSFHIDSPPSTAEFCQYFHANSSSRCSIETGFAQLTLTDAEQRELYEAALIIQNAYRRYIKRKKKKFKPDSSSQTIDSVYFNLNESDKKTSNLYSIDSSSSTSSILNSKNINNNLIDSDSFQTQVNYETVTPSNSINQLDQQKQFEAACVIQKYYRRYKQYEKLQNEAASKIQKGYRAYKLNGYRKISSISNNMLNSFHYHNSIDETTNESQPFAYSSTDELLPLNQKLIQRKIVNIRPNSRFSPSSPVSSSSSSSLISTQLFVNNRTTGSDNSNDEFYSANLINNNKQITQFETNINNFISTDRIDSNEFFINNR